MSPLPHSPEAQPVPSPRCRTRRLGSPTHQGLPWHLAVVVTKPLTSLDGQRSGQKLPRKQSLVGKKFKTKKKKRAGKCLCAFPQNSTRMNTWNEEPDHARGWARAATASAEGTGLEAEEFHTTLQHATESSTHAIFSFLPPTTPEVTLRYTQEYPSSCHCPHRQSGCPLP